MFKIIKKSSKFILIIFTISSCVNTPFQSQKYNLNVSKNDSEKSINKPRYDINGGYKKTNILNQKRAEREKYLIELEKLCKTTKDILEKQKNDLAKVEESHKLSGIEKSRDAVENEINILFSELNSIDVYTQSGYLKSLEVLSKLNDLIYGRIKPIDEIISKNNEIKELKGDFSFSTGSSKLTDSGIKDIKSQISDIEKEIIDWKNYLNNHNEKIFENDSYKLMIVIDGFADKVGSEELNLKLSKERAESVRNEYLKQLKVLTNNYNLIFDIQYLLVDYQENIQNKTTIFYSKEILL
jgi:outer membrane protein OmpA-like peptidoglycan-associated protein